MENQLIGLFASLLLICLTTNCVNEKKYKRAGCITNLHCFKDCSSTRIITFLYASADTLA